MSLSVEQGDIFGFIVPNGAGKTTTIRTLLALITYALAVVIRYRGDIDFLNVFSPFQYFITSDVVRSGLKSVFILLAIVVSAVAMFFAALRYRQRELLI